MALKKQNSEQKFSDLRSEIQSFQLKPVYYFYGEEDFYLDRLQNLCSVILPPYEKDFNFDLLYGQDVNPAQVLNIVRSFPMMAEKRVVIIKNFLQTGKVTDDEDSSKSGSMNDFIPYFDKPNPSTVLVLLDSSKPAGNTLLGKAISKNSNVGFYEFESLPDYMLGEWVSAWAKSRHKKNIDQAAAQTLAHFVGNNLHLLSTEIDKVCTFVDTSENVNLDDVKKIIGSYREYSAFELKDAVLIRDLKKSLFISEQMLQHSKSDTGELIRLVGFFYSVFTNIWHILRLVEKGVPKNKIQAELDISNAWYFNKLWEDASKFTYADMPRVFEALLDADRSIKGFSTQDTTTILFLLVKRLIG